MFLFGLGVYALTPGTAPNPGHTINEIAPPNSCSAGQFLKFDGTNWVCASVEGPWKISGNNIYYNDGNVGIGLSNPVARFQIGVEGKYNNFNYVRIGLINNGLSDYDGGYIQLGKSHDSTRPPCNTYNEGMLIYMRSSAVGDYTDSLYFCCYSNKNGYHWVRVTPNEV